MSLENTNKFLNPELSKSRWYAVLEGKLKGPLSTKEIIDNLENHSLNLASYLWKQELQTWVRIYDLEEFAPLLPKLPSEELREQAARRETTVSPPEAPPKDAVEREWFMYADDSQYGPFSESEVVDLIQFNKIHPETLLWKRGLKDWCAAAYIKELSELFPAQPPPAKKGTPKPPERPASAAISAPEIPTQHEQRSAPRKPFEVRLLLTDGEEVGWAVCRDISLGGMQVLMNFVPGPVGTNLRINVNPNHGIPGFACTGRIVRISSDHRAFSLQFTSLPENAKAAIAQYILAMHG